MIYDLAGVTKNGYANKYSKGLFWPAKGEREKN